MKGAPTPPPAGNGLIDIFLNGLKRQGEFNANMLGKLSTLSKLFNGRITKDWIWEQTLDQEDRNILGIPPIEMAKINRVADEIGVEYPPHQPSTDSQWDAIERVPKDIKKAMIELFPKFPDITTHVRVLWLASNNRHAVRSWLESLLGLYRSANEQDDLFHGLFLNNHNIAKRACDLAQKTTIGFSIDVLNAFDAFRFSSLTMNSEKLNLLFKDLENYFKERQKKERHYSSTLEIYIDAYIPLDDIKGFIKKNYYPQALLWRAAKASPVPTPAASQSSVNLAASTNSQNDEDERNLKRPRTSLSQTTPNGKGKA